MKSAYPLGKKFSLLTKLYIGIVGEALSDLEIERHFHALVVIDDNEGCLCQKELACRLHMDNVSMVRVLDYLHGKGMIVRMGNPKDRREHLIELTSRARKILPRIKEAIEKTNALCLENMSAGEQKEFKRLLDRVHENLHDQPKQAVKLNYKKITKK